MTNFPKMSISFHIFKMGTAPPHSTSRRWIKARTVFRYDSPPLLGRVLVHGGLMESKKPSLPPWTIEKQSRIK